MNGNLYLMRMGKQNLACILEQSAVGGDYRNETFLTGRCNEMGKQGMQKGFAHQMEIEKLDMPFQPVCQHIEFVLRKRLLYTFCLWTELAVQVADIGNFKVTS
jgi:hypothetical protein